MTRVQQILESVPAAVDLDNGTHCTSVEMAWQRRAAFLPQSGQSMLLVDLAILMVLMHVL